MIRISSRKITLIKQSKPRKGNVNTELQWFGSSLGLFGLRDKDKSCFRIFIELLKSAKPKQPISSDELALKLHLTRGTVVHHLTKLIESGIVIPARNKYLLRVDKLQDLVAELRQDIKTTMDDLEKIASDIDNVLGL